MDLIFIDVSVGDVDSFHTFTICLNSFEKFLIRSVARFQFDQFEFFFNTETLVSIIS